MAKKHFEEEQKPVIDFYTFVFMIVISFWLGMSIEAYKAQKHLDEIQLPKCPVQEEAPKQLPEEFQDGEKVENLESLQVFINRKDV